LLRVALFFALLLAVLFVWRALRHLGHVLFGPPPGRGIRREPRAPEQEMVRDPVCGAWIDRRVAIASVRDGQRVAVCSERCRRELESGTAQP
jgi:YHS domain-containing protein